jgi:hypothetical protein
VTFKIIFSYKRHEINLDHKIFQVDIEVNEAPVAIHMKLDDNGAAYFVEAVESDEEEQEIPPGNNFN